MSETQSIDAAGGYRMVRDRIAAAARDAGRPEADVKLVAVTKTIGLEPIRSVIAAGQLDFGENRVQEAKSKWPELKAAHPSTRLHLIGPLQTNKVKDAVELFDVIHSIDRPKLAEAMAAELAKNPRRTTLFIQVNTGEEAQKAGIGPREAGNFVSFCRDDLRLPIVGLMCIPPLDEEPALHFALLAKIARDNDLAHLSMGMSGDLETAIALGATHVRVGTAIFGDRPKP
jgi:pyridoxal phosphate enzyme (YggS family)